MLESVGEIGYEGTSVRTVLTRTQLYRQAFYDDFSSKEDCFLQAYDMGLDRVEARVRTAAANETDWRGQLRAGLGALLDLLDSAPNIGRALIVEVHPAGAAALAKRAAAMQRACDFLERARLEAPGGDAPRIAGGAIAGGIHTAIYSRLTKPDGAELRPLLPEFMYFAVLPYFGADAARAERARAR